jgi:hypothetical protein
MRLKLAVAALALVIATPTFAAESLMLERPVLGIETVGLQHRGPTRGLAGLAHTSHWSRRAAMRPHERLIARSAVIHRG